MVGCWLGNVKLHNENMSIPVENLEDNQDSDLINTSKENLKEL